jgi:hypothetical protein
MRIEFQLTLGARESRFKYLGEGLVHAIFRDGLCHSRTIHGHADSCVNFAWIAVDRRNLVMKLLKVSSLLITLALGYANHALAADETAKGNPAWIEHICSKPTDSAKVAEREQHHIDRVTERLKLTDTQKAAFKDLVDTRAKLRADYKANLCANKPDLSTLEKRLAFTQSWFEKRAADLKATTPKILTFYNTLDDKQKAEFDGFEQARHDHRH